MQYMLLSVELALSSIRGAHHRVVLFLSFLSFPQEHMYFFTFLRDVEEIVLGISVGMPPK